MIKQKHPIREIQWGVIPISNYRNCLLEKIIGGYKILNHIVTMPEEVDSIIDNAHSSLEASTKKK